MYKVFVAVNALALAFAATPYQAPAVAENPCVPMDSDIVVHDVAKTGLLKEIQFSLPPGASQGEGGWYRIRLHVGMARHKDSVGMATIDADTNDHTAGQIQFSFGKDGVAWSTVSAAEPRQNGHTTEDHADVRMVNFLQKDGVQSGQNRLSFRAELDDGASLDSVTVYRDTCIEQTPISPESLKVEAQVIPAAPVLGRPVTLRVRVSNVGSGAISKVTVGVVPGDGEVAITSAASKTTTGLSGQWTADFVLAPQTLGKHEINVDVGTGISPRAGGDRITISVAPAPNAGGLGFPLAALVLATLAGLGVWLYFKHRRYA